MKIKDKARTIIIKGLTLHLKGIPLKKINSFYNLNFKKYSLDQKDISFVNYLTSVCIRNRGVIEAVLNKYIKKKTTNKWHFCKGRYNFRSGSNIIFKSSSPCCS